jgi:hypothetical protein
MSSSKDSLVWPLLLKSSTVAKSHLIETQFARPIPSRWVAATLMMLIFVTRSSVVVNEKEKCNTFIPFPD